MRGILSLAEKDTEKIIADPATNYPAERVLLDDLIAGYNAYNNNTTHPPTKSREIFASLANMSNSEVGRKVVFILLTHEATTQYELTEHILADTSTVSRILKKLRLCGIAEKVGIIEKRYRSAMGPPIHVWALCGADPMVSIRAQERYRDLKLKENGYKQKRLMKAKEDEYEAKQKEDAAIEGYAQRVIRELGLFSLDQSKALQKINAGLSMVKVPAEYSESVKNEVIDHFYKVKLGNIK